MDYRKPNDVLLSKALPIPTLMNVKTREYYDVLKKQTHLVGRTGFGADLEISDDRSISRCHAHLILVKKVVGSKVELFLTLVDKKSKYGTFINALDKQIESNCPTMLRFGDKIRFGIFDSIWIVEKYPLMVCPSQLRTADIEILEHLMTIIGGQITYDWSVECSHICVNFVTVTDKVLLGLASAKSIVPLQYFIDLCTALSPGLLLEVPFCMDYKPKLAKSLLNPSSLPLDVNNKRRTLFSGKTFICSTVNQLNRFSELVKLAGGEIINYFDGILSDDDILSCSKYILMQQDPENEENNYMYLCILEKLKMMNKRSIPENDIGFAIIFSNTTKYCNANFNVSLVDLEYQSYVIKLQESVVLAPETEVLTVNDSKLISLNTVPDTLPNAPSNFKRPLGVCDSKEIILPTKRSLLTNGKKKNKIIKTIGIQEELKLFRSVIEPTTSSMSSSQFISNSNKVSAWIKATVADNNGNNTNILQSKTVDNLSVPTKKNISNYHSVFNNKEAYPMEYVETNEVEEHPVKRDNMDSIFFPIVDTSLSNNKSELSKIVEANTNVAVDPNFILNIFFERLK